MQLHQVVQSKLQADNLTLPQQIKNIRTPIKSVTAKARTYDGGVSPRRAQAMQRDRTALAEAANHYALRWRAAINFLLHQAIKEPAQ